MQPVKTNKIQLLPVLVGIIILIPLLVVAGCTGQAPAPRLEGTGWTLTGIMDKGTMTQPLSGTKVTLDFSNDGQISGNAGCNHYFASSTLKGTTITIGPAGSTEMYCVTPGVMDQESAYLSLLSQAKIITLTVDTLILSDTKGTPILTYAKTVQPAPASLVGTNWTLSSFHSADAVSSVIAGTTITAIFGDDGRVGGSGGCNRYFASYNVTGTSLSISSVGSTKLYCGSEGVMQQESTYFASLSKAMTFTIKGNQLSMADAKGSTILSFVKDA
jgi:heat shock protein HslJ